MAAGSAIGAWAGEWIGGRIGGAINNARDRRDAERTRQSWAGQMPSYVAAEYYARQSGRIEQIKAANPPPAPEVNLTTNVTIEESANGFEIQTEVYQGDRQIAAETGYQPRSMVP